jgi:hypothetical protein
VRDSKLVRVGINQDEKLRALSQLLGKDKREVLDALIDIFYQEVVVVHPELAISLIELKKASLQIPYKFEIPYGQLNIAVETKDAQRGH